ncbi:MAG: NADH-quinone oxidoreductase subunit NuoE [Alphaproteobacteria bacterium]|nr:NADH-quinone oxidoreductase subunit NuoE [Alphaproteobacteria bacterium]HCQ70850.1 NADH-quinone oxidoreductase subunit NuoE [Rhodospirillaceae bacterium]|tara:strand:- start:19335 stop:19994 length:660 start_codon:yes stop_codon:yes gene_type:complete
MKKPFELHADYQPESFEFTKAYQKKIKDVIALYPPGRQQSAVMPLLDLAQRQVGEEGAKATPVYGGWIPRAAMDHIAEILDMPAVKVYEVATFYSMYNLAPVGKHLVQICTTTPCWLNGSDGVVKTCKDKLGIQMNETTEDGQFTIMEVECLGACVNAPMVQINDDYYEDLTPETMAELIDILGQDMKPTVGSQKGRACSMAASGPTVMLEGAKKAKVV